MCEYRAFLQAVQQHNLVHRPGSDDAPAPRATPRHAVQISQECTAKPERQRQHSKGEAGIIQRAFKWASWLVSGEAQAASARAAAPLPPTPIAPEPSP